MVAIALDKSDNPHIAYNLQGALVIADRVGGLWQSHTVLSPSRDVQAFAFVYGHVEGQPYVAFTTSATDQPLQCATPFFGIWLVQPIGSDPAFATAQVPALATSSGADPRLHLLAVWDAYGLEMAWDSESAIAFTRAHLIACPDSDAVSKVRMWTTLRYPVTTGPVTLDFTALSVWDSTYVCSAGLTYLYGSIGTDTAATFVIKASGTVSGGIGVRYGGSTGTLVEPSAALAGVDQNGDGAVTLADQDLVVSRFGTSDARSDLNFDGVVDTTDREILLAHLWHGCTPAAVGPAGPPEGREHMSLAIGPNPMGRWTRVTLSLPVPASVRVEVLDPSGRRLRVLHDGAVGAGAHSLTWDGRDDAGREVGSGLYLISATTGNQHVVARVVHIR